MAPEERLLFNKAHPTNETRLPISSGEPAAEPDRPTDNRSTPPFRVRSPGPLRFARRNAWRTENVIAMANKILRRAMGSTIAEEPARPYRKPLGYKNGEPYYHQRPGRNRGKIDSRWLDSTELTSSPIPPSSPASDVSGEFVHRLSPSPLGSRYSLPPRAERAGDDASENGEEETDEENANQQSSPDQAPTVPAKRTPPPPPTTRRAPRWTMKPETEGLETVQEVEDDEGMWSPAPPTAGLRQDTANESVLPELVVAVIDEGIAE